jgi:flagellar biosynthesis protein FlhF
MRLKTFTGKTMKEVMGRVRDELGPDAIIIKEDQGARVGGCRVTAAYEGTPNPATPIDEPYIPELTPQARSPEEAAAPGPIVPKVAEYDPGEVTAIFSYNGVPFDMAMRLQQTIASVETSSLPEALSIALETSFKFSPLAMSPLNPIILIGPPGAGKTVTAAKLAAEAVINRTKTNLLTIDTIKNSGVQQLEYFAKLMKINVVAADTPQALEAAILKAAPNRENEAFTLIDSFGINPFDLAEVKHLAHFIKTSGAEPIAVLPAGLDPMEAKDMAEVFSELGARRLIITRLDAARRYASLLLAAQAGPLALAGFSRSPFVAEHVEPASSIALARMMTNLPRTSRTAQQQRVNS